MNNRNMKAAVSDGEVGFWPGVTDGMARQESAFGIGGITGHEVGNGAVDDVVFIPGIAHPFGAVASIKLDFKWLVSQLLHAM